MLRQRLRIPSSSLAAVGKAVLVVVSLALIWYGLMLMLLALGADPATIDAISGYRTAYNFLAGLTPDDISGTTRLIAGIAGLVAFLLFAYLAYQELPRPHLARHDLRIAADDRGTVEVGPRALERVAEVAASEHRGVTASAGRLVDDELTVGVTLRSAREVDGTLADVQRRVREALGRHDLGAGRVSVTLTGYDRQRRRELQ